MKKPTSHQIDEKAQLILRDSLPPTWVINDQRKDYAKDFIVEISDEDGNLTGESFIVQLKGQLKARIISKGSLVTFSLKSKYATYYIDKVKDLPVFLVVVDINQKTAWWLFLQPELQANQNWRHKKSLSVRLPFENELTDSKRFEDAVFAAKKWLRLQHAASIEESVLAHKQKLKSADPRFDVRVSLKNEKPNFELLPNESVKIKMQFQGKRIVDKVRDLIDRGKVVAFEPGEVKISGSEIFTRFANGGCSIQSSFNRPGTISLICCDADGKELARLDDLPGAYTGGQKEIWFQGALAKSPVSYRFGPFVPGGANGVAKLDFDFIRWDGQRLTMLAYFDRLFKFISFLPLSSSTFVEFQSDGNSLIKNAMNMHNEPFIKPLAGYFELVEISRQIARHFKLRNPIWSAERFDDEYEVERAEQLYGIAFQNGWEARKPKLKLTVDCDPKDFKFEEFKKAERPGRVRLASDEVRYRFFDEEIEVGNLAFDYFNVNTELIEHDCTKVTVAIIGTKDTVKRITKLDVNAEEAFKDSELTSRCNVATKT